MEGETLLSDILKESTSTLETTRTYTNPVYSGYFADPFVWRHKGEYYAVGTGTVEASGPYGRFCLMDADANKRYLLVATGTGVTPYRAMLPQLEKLAARGAEVALVYGARNETELLYGEEFEAFAQKYPHFHFYACFSRTPRTPARAHDRDGRVHVALAELKPDPAHDIAYLCGNPEMVDQAFALLKDAGLPIPHIRREKYVSSR